MENSTFPCLKAKHRADFYKTCADVKQEKRQRGAFLVFSHSLIFNIAYKYKKLSFISNCILG